METMEIIENIENIEIIEIMEIMEIVEIIEIMEIVELKLSCFHCAIVIIEIRNSYRDSQASSKVHKRVAIFQPNLFVSLLSLFKT